MSGRIVFEGCSLMLILHASKSVSRLLNLLWQPSLHKVVVMAHAWCSTVLLLVAETVLKIFSVLR